LNKKKLQEIPNILEAEFEFRGSVGQSKQEHDGFEEYVHYIHNALDDYHCDIQDFVIEPNKEFAKMLFSGVHKDIFMGYPATHRHVSWAVAALFVVASDKKLWEGHPSKNRTEEAEFINWFNSAIESNVALVIVDTLTKEIILIKKERLRPFLEYYS